MLSYALLTVGKIGQSNSLGLFHGSLIFPQKCIAKLKQMKKKSYKVKKAYKIGDFS